MTAEALIDAIVVMIEKQDVDVEEDEDESTKKEDIAHAPQFASDTKDEIRDDLFNFFESEQKTFFGAKGSHENRLHINLAELREKFNDIDNLLTAENDPDLHKRFQILNLLVTIVPLGEKFSGKHGTGLVSLAEFTKILDEAYMSDLLRYKNTATFLDASIDFERDALNGGLIIHSSGNLTSPPVVDRFMHTAMQDDAKQLVERFSATYKECEDLTAMA
jgi:hypothetical protein